MSPTPFRCATFALTWCFLAGSPAALLSAPAPEPDDLEVVRQILREISIQPNPLTRGDSANLKAEDLPRFSPKVLAGYARDGNKSDFRDTVVRTRDQLGAQITTLVLKDQIRADYDPPSLKLELVAHQKAVARAMRILKEAHEELKKAGEDRGKETSRRWQAHYDYMLARIQIQMAFLFEYQTALARVRKDDLPPLAGYADHNAWKLVLCEEETGDHEGKKISREARKQLQQIVSDYPETPWAELAGRALKLPAGLQWQSCQVK